MKYVCLLRGINVGGSNKVSMLELKKSFETMGYKNVATYINSGNVIFETRPKPDPKDIQKQLKKSFGVTIPVIVLTANQAIRISESIPDGWQNDSLQLSDVVYLLPEVDDANFAMKAGYNSDIETALYVPGAVIWNVTRKNQSQSGLHRLIGTDLYKKVTIRNVNTARKLADLVR